MKKVKIGKQIFVPLILAAFWLTAAESFAIGDNPKVTLKVDESTERDEDVTETTRQNVYGDDITTRTDTGNEICTLTIEVKMQDEAQLDCQLEWFFISENMKDIKDKGTLKIFDLGKKPIALQEKVALEEILTSKPFVMTHVREDSEAADKQSGDEYKGYVVLVTRRGEILAKESNSSRFLKKEWLDQYQRAQ